MGKRRRHESNSPSLQVVNKRPRLDLLNTLLEKDERDAVEALLLLKKDTEKSICLESKPLKIERVHVVLDHYSTCPCAAALSTRDNLYGVRNVIVKSLKLNDTEDRQSCLSIPANYVMSKFLNDEEEQLLTQEVDGKKCKLPVKVRGCNSIEDHELFLRRWNYHSNRGFKYVLTGKWNLLREESRLQKGDEIQVFAFRSKGVLCLGIHGGTKLLSLPPTWRKKLPRGSNHLNFLPLKQA